MPTKFSAEKELIGKNLAGLRKQAGFTQHELAAKLNISRSTLGEYERGRLRLHDLLIIKIAKELNTSPNDILGFKKTGTNTGVNPSLKFVKRFKKIEELNYAKQKKILSTLDDLIVAAQKKP